MDRDDGNVGDTCIKGKSMFRVTRIELKFEPRDLWIGVYWNRHWYALEVYICIVPLLPLKVVFPGLRRNRAYGESPNWPN